MKAPEVRHRFGEERPHLPKKAPQPTIKSSDWIVAAVVSALIPGWLAAYVSVFIWAHLSGAGGPEQVSLKRPGLSRHGKLRGHHAVSKMKNLDGSTDSPDPAPASLPHYPLRAWTRPSGAARPISWQAPARDRFLSRGRKCRWRIRCGRAALVRAAHLSSEGSEARIEWFPPSPQFGEPRHSLWSCGRLCRAGAVACGAS